MEAKFNKAWDKYIANGGRRLDVSTVSVNWSGIRRFVLKKNRYVCSLHLNMLENDSQISTKPETSVGII